MNKARVLSIEDDEDIQELIRYNLTKEGYKVESAGSGEEGLKAARWAPPDIILLDLMLPGIDGFEVCKEVRAEENLKHIPILMLTAKGEEPDIVTGLELGADDYLTKPFSPRVLAARIKTILRRGKQAPAIENKEGKVIKIDQLVIHPGRHEVLLDNKLIDLTFTEFRVLHFLARRPGWVFSRSDIVEGVRGDDYPVTDRSVDVQVSGLRKKLGQCGNLIETVRGIGYRFSSQQ